MSILETIIGITIGSAVTFLVSRYFYQKSNLRRISFRATTSADIFEGLDEDLREDLKISFKDEHVVDLFQLELDIENSGDQPIKDFSMFPSIKFPQKASIIYTSIVEKAPDSFEVELERKRLDNGMEKIVFPMSLMNPNDYFRVKLLLDSEIDLSDLSLNTRAESTPSEVPVSIEKEEFSEKENVDDEEPAAFGFIAIILFVISTLYVKEWPSEIGVSLMPNETYFVHVIIGIILYSGLLFSSFLVSLTLNEIYNGVLKNVKRVIVYLGDKISEEEL